MKTQINLSKVAGKLITASALIASGMLMLASCSKDEVSGPITSTSSGYSDMRTDQPVITGKHTNCKTGDCAEYDFKAYNDGWIVYNGYNNVGKIGHYEFQIEKGTPLAVVQAAVNQGFLKLKSTYPFQDGTSISFETILNAGKVKGVTDYGLSVPDFLTSIKQMFLDKLGISPLIAISTVPEQPIISMKHAGPGICPQYNVSLYANGKMVYEGLSNVKTIGIKEVQFTPETVIDLVNISRDLGFLELKDAYPYSEQPSTQTTIIIDNVVKSVADFNVEIPDNLTQIKTNIEDKLAIKNFVF